jgi:glycosyltransferase involved in cell wall biosynthesis
MRHFMARHLATYCNVLFCELDQAGAPACLQVEDRIVVFTPGWRLPGVGRLRLMMDVYRRYQAGSILRLVQELPASKRILLNFQYDFIQVYRRQNGFAGHFTVLNDDFINMVPTDSAVVRRRKWMDQSSVVCASDRVFVASELLASDVRPHGRPVSVIHSGHDFRPEWNDPRRCRSEEVRVCFVGFMHSWLRLEWIVALASCSDVAIDMIGPVEDKTVADRLNQCRNVRVHSPLVGKALQQAVSRCDVCIMPYQPNTGIAKATVPSKLFPYLACGKPVVAGGVEHLIPLPHGFVYRARTAEEFVALVLRAKREDSAELAQQRIEFAAAHTWENRIQEMWDLMSRDIGASSLR